MNVTFDKFVRSASGHSIPRQEIDDWHEQHPRESSLHIRPDKNGLASTLFGLSKTAFGYHPSHYQTSEERARAKYERKYGPNAIPASNGLRRTAKFANDQWQLYETTEKGSWFTHKTLGLIFIAAGVLAATGFALCGTGTKRKKIKKGMKKNKKGTRRNKGLVLDK